MPEPLIHGYAITQDTATWLGYTQLLHVLIPLLYRLTGIHAVIVFVFLLHGSGLFLLHGSWIYSRYMAH